MPSIDVGGEVFRNLRLELLAVSTVVDPFAGGGDPFTGGDRRRVADDGHQVAVSACPCPENAETILRVVEGNPLDDGGEDFLGRLQLRLHANRLILLRAARCCSTKLVERVLVMVMRCLLSMVTICGM